MEEEPEGEWLVQVEEQPGQEDRHEKHHLSQGETTGHL